MSNLKITRLVNLEDIRQDQTSIKTGYRLPDILTNAARSDWRMNEHLHYVESNDSVTRRVNSFLSSLLLAKAENSKRGMSF